MRPMAAYRLVLVDLPTHAPKAVGSEKECRGADMLEALARNRRWLYVRGVAALIFGALAFVWPRMTLLALVYLFGAFALIDGVATLVLVLRGRRPSDTNVWMLVLVGVLGIAAGIISFVWPDITAVALLILVAAWAIARGILEIVAAVRLRKEIEREWLFGLAGLVSIAFGVLLVLQPQAGLLALVWLVGLFAMIIGVLYIALGMRLARYERAFRHASRAA